LNAPEEQPYVVMGAFRCGQIGGYLLMIHIRPSVRFEPLAGPELHLALAKTFRRSSSLHRAWLPLYDRLSIVTMVKSARYGLNDASNR
jgi:hypothetical protein